MDSVKYSDHESQNPSCPPDWTPPALSVVDNISITHMDGRSANFLGSEVFRFVGLSEMPITNVYLEYIHFSSRLSIGWNCSAVSGRVRNGSVTPWPPCDGFTIVQQTPCEVSRQAPMLSVTEMKQISCNTLMVLLLLPPLLLYVLRLCLSEWKSRLQGTQK